MVILSAFDIIIEILMLFMLFRFTPFLWVRARSRFLLNLHYILGFGLQPLVLLIECVHVTPFLKLLPLRQLVSE